MKNSIKISVLMNVISYVMKLKFDNILECSVHEVSKYTRCFTQKRLGKNLRENSSQ